jgi:hypothetical protein
MRMKSIFLLSIAAVLAASIAMAKEPAGDPMAGMPMGAPPEMKSLEFLVGTWDVNAKMKMTPADTNWMVSKATCTYSYLLDGCVMQMDYAGPMMGMNFHGMGFHSYNRFTSKWQVVWSDNMMGTLSNYEGTKKDGVTVVEGIETMMGMTFQVRMTTFNEKPTSFDWKSEQSMDGGTTWFENMNAHYTKRAK